MADLQLGVIETRFADLIWENEPISSSTIVKLAEQQLHWKKSTTYTVLKRLCDKGIFQNQNGLVTSLLNKQEFSAMQSERFVEDAFQGSLPAFLAAFSSRKKLSEKEVAALRQLVASYEEE
jgi:predicted transcriptional regulator